MLENQLSLVENKKVILFVHHPPFPTGLEAMDAIRLENPKDLYSILENPFFFIKSTYSFCL